MEGRDWKANRAAEQEISGSGHSLKVMPGPARLFGMSSSSIQIARRGKFEDVSVDRA